VTLRLRLPGSDQRVEAVRAASTRPRTWTAIPPPWWSLFCCSGR
jgi:hypothetical protein